MIDWLNDWLTYWLIDWMIVWLIDCLHNWLIDWLQSSRGNKFRFWKIFLEAFKEFLNHFIQSKTTVSTPKAIEPANMSCCLATSWKKTAGSVPSRRRDFVINWYFSPRLIDWLIDWLTDWLIDWLIDWLTDWLIDWLTDCLTDWHLEHFDVILDWSFNHWLIELISTDFLIINFYWLFSQQNFILVELLN